MRLKKVILLLLSLVIALNVKADTANSSEQNLISFTSEVTKAVSYDVMQVSIFVKQENKNLKELNQSINKKVNMALDMLAKQSTVEVKSNTRHTEVNYDSKGKPSGWVESGDLVLENKDFVALSQVISELNDVFAISQVSQKLSKTATEKVEDEMIQMALSKFKHKAQVIQESFNAKGYKIVNLKLDNEMDMPYLGRSFEPIQAKMMPFSDSTENVKLNNSDKAELKVIVSAQIVLLN